MTDHARPKEGSALDAVDLIIEPIMLVGPGPTPEGYRRLSCGCCIQRVSE